MSEETGPAIVPAGSIIPGRQYSLRLKKPVKWDTIELLPIHDHMVSGRVLAHIMEAYTDAVDASAPV
jgi:hypothetical protein